MRLAASFSPVMYGQLLHFIALVVVFASFQLCCLQDVVACPYRLVNELRSWPEKAESASVFDVSAPARLAEARLSSPPAAVRCRLLLRPASWLSSGCRFHRAIAQFRQASAIELPPFSFQRSFRFQRPIAAARLLSAFSFEEASRQARSAQLRRFFAVAAYFQFSSLAVEGRLPAVSSFPSLRRRRLSALSYHFLRLLRPSASATTSRFQAFAGTPNIFELSSSAFFSRQHPSRHYRCHCFDAAHAHAMPLMPSLSIAATSIEYWNTGCISILPLYSLLHSEASGE